MTGPTRRIVRIQKLDKTQHEASYFNIGRHRQDASADKCCIVLLRLLFDFVFFSGRVTLSRHVEWVTRAGTTPEHRACQERVPPDLLWASGFVHG